VRVRGVWNHPAILNLQHRTESITSIAIRTYKARLELIYGDLTDAGNLSGDPHDNQPMRSITWRRRAMCG